LELTPKRGGQGRRSLVRGGQTTGRGVAVAVDVVDQVNVNGGSDLPASST
jgi:hypothetical protein